ncbi:MAG: type VI secretion system baseplate subunit TssF [Deltaproteobacteria bacterium]|nr:type VI secretion system baseplate subunit TssF [Deltaproteobacteria bacterium]
MDPRLLRQYNRELQHVREMGGEFAQAFPKIAGRLGLDTFECSDPYVERLLEAFAFLTARVQLRLDSEFPRFTQHLLEMVYPHYLAPTPSMLVAEFAPNHGEGALVEGFRVAKGTSFRSRATRDEPTPCRYVTGQDVTLWPIVLEEAEYSGFLGGLSGLSPSLIGKAKSILRLRLKATGNARFKDLKLDQLPLFIKGGGEMGMRIYEQVMANATAVIVSPPGRQAAWREVITDQPISPVGFTDDEALLPYGNRSFQGYRLLQEYFAFPSRFLFFALNNLRPALRRADTQELEIQIVLDRREDSLEGVVDKSRLALFCAPAVNLFPLKTDRIHLNERDTDYHIVPDRTRPYDFEVHGVTDVVGFGASVTEKRRFLPLYAPLEGREVSSDPAYYTVLREPRLLSEKQRAQGPRSKYVGSEVFLALVDGQEGPYKSDLKQLSVDVLCSNRDLPLHMPLGVGDSDFILEAGAPTTGVKCVAGPTPPRESHAHGDTAWRLISQLSFNYLSLANTDATQGASVMRELLRLYGDFADNSVRKQIEGVRGLTATGITRRLPISGPTVFGRGVEMQLILDEAAFEGSGVYLLGQVLARFFARFVSINSFTETVLFTPQRGEVARWPVTLGLRPIL